MLKNIVTFTQELIRIQSNPDNVEALNESLDVVLSRLDSFTIERFSCNGTRSALVYNKFTRPKKFRLLFNLHLDVIPAKEEQYEPRIEGNKLYGAGVMDMKANAVCVILAFIEVAKKVNAPIALQIVTDEEIGGFKGTKYQIEKHGVDADFVIATEPTNFDIVHKAKGVLWCNITTIGKSAHGAYPWRGENAVWKMNNVLNNLKKEFFSVSENDWATTINLSDIETTNSAYNKIPDTCLLKLDVRYIPEDSQQIVEKIRGCLSKGDQLEVVTNEPAMHTDSSNKDVQNLRMYVKKYTQDDVLLRGANGSSDARHFVQKGVPGIEFGPIGGGIGADEEWVDISSLETYYKLLKEFIVSLDN